jgi:hypothetical protein
MLACFIKSTLDYWALRLPLTHAGNLNMCLSCVSFKVIGETRFTRFTKRLGETTTVKKPLFCFTHTHTHIRTHTHTQTHRHTHRHTDTHTLHLHWKSDAGGQPLPHNILYPPPPFDSSGNYSNSHGTSSYPPHQPPTPSSYPNPHSNGFYPTQGVLCACSTSPITYWVHVLRRLLFIVCMFYSCLLFIVCMFYVSYCSSYACST